MKSLKKLKFKPLSNKSVIEEEKSGYGDQFLQGYKTSIKDSRLRSDIRHMSVLEVIN